MGKRKALKNQGSEFRKDITTRGGRQPPRPYPAHHAGDGRKREMAPQMPQGIRP